jgi:UDP-N-acetylmuramate-alanine ligase
MKDSPELQEAYRLKEENHKPLLIRDYFTFLGEMSKLFKTIGITGTNGKSSSTSMMVVTATKVLENF